MIERKKASRKARLFVACALLLAACSKHDVQSPTPWLRVDVSRPRADEMIRIGSIEERYEVKVDGRWQRLGVGHRSGYRILGEEALTASAAVVTLDDPRGTWLVRPDAAPQRLDGELYFPNAMNIDVLQNSGSEARIDRYDATGKQIGSFAVSVPGAYSDCRIVSIKGYVEGIPHLDTACKPSSPQARCVLIAAGKEQVIYAVKPDQPQQDCEFAKLHLVTHSPTYQAFN